MPLVFQRELALTSKQLLSDPRLEGWVGHTLELWLFEDVQARQALTAQLQKRGIEARVRSAYKPLLYAFLEEIDITSLAAVHIEYPCHDGADPRRFLLEGYPLETIIPEVQLFWGAAAEQTVAEQPTYRVTLTTRAGVKQRLTILAPNALKTDIALGLESLSPVGYLRVLAPHSSQVLCAQTLETEFEQAYAELMRWISEESWLLPVPFFERLVLRVELPGAEIFDGQGRLLASTYEALHEDLYFSALEFFQRLSKKSPGDRGVQPGQIVPDIRVTAGAVKLSVERYPVGATLPDLRWSAAERGSLSATVTPTANLATCREPLDSEVVHAALALLEGQAFEANSRQGRTVKGIYRRGSLPGLVLTGGQHANEASGVVGALRGAQWLAAQPQAHFAVVPLENPDGYALYTQYRALHPQHLHHAARYTGLGDDLEYREQAPWYEAQARQQAVALTGAQLHLSLHGYPAHEWTRPLTGYVPRGFSDWSIPRGFFLIVRYQAAYQQLALRWLESLTESLSHVAGLADFNRTQLRQYESYVGSSDFDVKHGIVCLLAQNDRQNVGIKLVTEFPDETILGEDFVFAQQIQAETVRFAATHWWRLAQAPSVSQP